jgi:hypothetical protein
MAVVSARAVPAARTSSAAAEICRASEAQLRLLLASGGDERLWLDPVTRRNRYGAPAQPAPDELWFSSSTACAISPRGWEASGQALGALISPAEGQGGSIAGWFDDLRARLLAIYGASGSQAVLSASGTEAEFLCLSIAARLADGPLVNLVVAPAETGTGVPAAASGRHFLGRASLGGAVTQGELLAGFGQTPIALETIEIRAPDGCPRAMADVDREAAERVDRAVRAGAFALLHVLDASKTGRSGVSRKAAREILARHPGRVLAVVDACQLRCSAMAIRADLEAGLAVMITGSKFAGGPPFCGALLLPAALAEALRQAPPPAEALGQYSAALDWPEGLRQGLRHPANLGLGLRWAAALAEIERYEAIPEARRADLLARFDTAVRARVRAARGLRLLDADGGVQGLVPVIHEHAHDARAVHDALRAPETGAFPACHLGQPVVVGGRTALRVCASMPMLASAAADGFAPLEADIDLAFAAWAAALAQL